jgi:putative sigma-54 modulation protein
MQMIITGRHLDITPALREYAETRLKKLEKYLNKSKEAAVILTVEKHRHIAEISLRVDGYLVQAEEETSEMYASIDRATDKIGRQLRRYKERLQNHKGKTGASKDAVSDTEEEVPGRIAKKDRLSLTHMSPNEAAVQMDLVDKGFYVFYNNLEGKINIVFKRKDGSVGLIDPVY